MNTPVYRLPPRRTGTALFGASSVQVSLLAVGVGGLAAGPALLGPPAGVFAGATVLLTCLILGFARVEGHLLITLIPIIAGYLLRASIPTAGDNDDASTPPGLGDPPTVGRADTGGSAAELPRCLRALELLRPHTDDVPTIDGHPLGLLRDRRTGAVTVVVDVRGGSFGLAAADEQHRRIAGWAHVLSQSARDPRVSQLGWTVRSGHRDPPTSPERTVTESEAAYRRIVEDTAGFLLQHEIRLWMTIDPPRTGRPVNARTAALGATETLTARCRAAGLDVRGALSADGILRTVRDHADATSTHDAITVVDVGPPGGPATRAHLPPPTAAHPLPLSRQPSDPRDLIVESTWTAARIGETWHRVLWIAQWPAHALHPEWLSPLLHEAPGTRTLAVAMTPVPWRVSRRRLNSDSVSAQTAAALRDRHAFRIPAPLTHAHDDIDRRDAELTAGFPEFAYVGLLDLAAASRDDLDATTAATVELAARCGITDLRPLHGRHAAAWPATLPLGLAPRRPVTGDH
ncbi:hypothetical protein [Parafrankia sp. EUN1f]|uniref:hypothetical protein n=1 Tax=Parafrankia sp. EUN1f TaxID=102897 RepID=UPI0001C474A0|nr:hypothetical protein [Parafrankia sp. EUN1f]EFC79900.1 hypothetical protein FrEUN1fDRAFT_6992 [Parafrankia sp. EUN1f]